MKQTMSASPNLNHQKLSYPQFNLIQQIGTGSFGTVFRAIHKPTGKQVAIKRIDLESSDDDVEEIQKEIGILASCNDDFITRYFGCFMHEFELWIVMEFLGGGSCLDLVKELKPTTLSESAIAEILIQVCGGLLYLHESGKIHRDIKAANVLISENGDVKIADFGVAAQLSNNMSRRNTFVGTPFWMAPEVIDQLNYSFSADVWSLGITAIELAVGKPPLSNLHPMKALFNIPRSQPPRLDSRYSTEFQDFVSQCLQMKPDQRATIKTLLKHKFLKKRSRQELLQFMNQRLPPIEQDTTSSMQTLKLDGASTLVNTTNGSMTTIMPDESHEEEDDGGWDFDTVKPQPSLEQILQHPPANLAPAPVPQKETREIGTITSAESNLVRIFQHAAHKFKEPVLMEISELLRTDPLTVGVEQYLLKRIGRLTNSHSKEKEKFDAVERILLEKWKSE